MSDEKTVTNHIMPRAAPSEDEIRRWQALPEDERLRRLKQALADGISSGAADSNFDAIIAEAQAELQSEQPDGCQRH